MKTHAYNMETVTEQDVFNAYRNEFKSVGRVSMLAYELGDGITESYPQVHLTDTLTAVLHDDINEIALKIDGHTFLTVARNTETVALLHDKAAVETLVALAAYQVPQ